MRERKACWAPCKPSQRPQCGGAVRAVPALLHDATGDAITKEIIISYRASNRVSGFCWRRLLTFNLVDHGLGGDPREWRRWDRVDINVGILYLFAISSGPGVYGIIIAGWAGAPEIPPSSAGCAARRRWCPTKSP